MSHHPKQNKAEDLTKWFSEVFIGLTSFHTYFYKAVGYYFSHVSNKTISKSTKHWVKTVSVKNRQTYFPVTQKDPLQNIKFI